MFSPSACPKISLFPSLLGNNMYNITTIYVQSFKNKCKQVFAILSKYILVDGKMFPTFSNDVYVLFTLNL